MGFSNTPNRVFLTRLSQKSIRKLLLDLAGMPCYFGELQGSLVFSSLSMLRRRMRVGASGSAWLNVNVKQSHFLPRRFYPP